MKLTYQASWQLHHNRALHIGRALQEYLAEHPPFESYQEFKRWAGLQIGEGDQVVRNSLVRVGLWKSGIHGHAGGTQLEDMLHLIVAYAKMWEVRR